MRYIHPTGRTYFEAVQHKMKRGREVFIFTSLKNELGNLVHEALWVPEEMKELMDRFVK